jgi:hypothetical protein
VLRKFLQHYRGDWQDELAEGIRRSSSCAVFVGPSGIGDWERLEFKLATDRMAKDRDFRVFLVLLPDLPEPFDIGSLPPFLSTRTWVDMRGGTGSGSLQKLINAVKGVAPGPETPIKPRDDICPYRGLRAFDEKHAQFYGSVAKKSFSPNILQRTDSSKRNSLRPKYFLQHYLLS